MQSRKKKTMKTTSQKNNSGAREQIRNIEQTNTRTTPTPQTPATKPDNRLPIDHEARKQNRTLPTPTVLARLRELAPEAFTAAQVVGAWVPMFLTRAVYDAYVAVPPNVTGQDEAGRLWDVVWMTRFAILRHRGGPATSPNPCITSAQQF